MNKTTKNRLFLTFIALACALPVVASYLAYYVWTPEKHMNYGELLTPRPIPEDKLVSIGSGTPLHPELVGKWVLVDIDNGQCDAACIRRLYLQRQAHISMGAAQERMTRLWIVTGSAMPSAELLAQHPGLHLVQPSPELLAHFPPPATGRFYLVDTHGELILRYPADPDGKRLIKDLARLLVVKRM
ncbi:MAG: hypothetical protein JSR19_02650 [Proteobacteria bacterium]|nr:hypothetical protein [Pseudomonadota bacterium]HQR03900.1 hypothetical protein [Rhodocyclaceae bacterium]